MTTSKNKIIFLSVLTSFCTGTLFATPEFAREQSADCSVCHTNIPMLNETGQSFLRNGFRFSFDDPTTVDNVLKGKTDGSKHIPLAMMLRQSYSSQQHKVTEKVKLYTGGSLTKNISFFGLTQKVYNHQDNSNAPEYFEGKSSRAYFQINIEDNQHVVRVGLLSPFTQFGNIVKSSADSGLKGGDGENEQNGKGMDDNSHFQTKKYGQGNGQGQGQGQGQGNGQGNGQGQGQNEFAQRGNQRYKTPLQISAFSKFKGVEYSYLYNSKWLLLLSYGRPIDESNQDNSKGYAKGRVSDQSHNSDDEYQFVSGIRYYTDSGYKIGLMYNKFQAKRENTFSLLLPIEKEFDKFILNSTLVYKNNKDQNDYYGIENSIVYSLNENSYIRAIFNMDRDENKDENYGYSLSYSTVYKEMAMFHLAAIRKDTSNDDDDLIQASISLLF